MHVCVCVVGGWWVSCLETAKILMYCFYWFIKNNTLLKTAVELAAACSLLREWGGAWDIQLLVVFFFWIMMPLRNSQLPNLMISVCKTCSTLLLHYTLLSVFHKYHCIGITFTYRKSSVSPNGGGGGLYNLGLKEGELNRNGGGVISINTKFNFLKERQISYVSAMSFIP